MFQFIKFASVGALNTIIDLGVLNGLILVFGLGISGTHYTYFKSISFACAVINSYFFNKYWVFKKKETFKTKEPILFAVVSITGLFLNVGVSGSVFKMVTLIGNIPLYLAVNIGAVAGIVVVLAFNFLGYKFLVFKK